MGRKREVPTEADQEILKQAAALKEGGLSWAETAKRMNVSKSWLRYRLDPVYRSYRLEAGRVDHCYSAAHSTRVAMTNEQLAEYQKLIPDDTRDFTARFFGDPIPGDRRRAA